MNTIQSIVLFTKYFVSEAGGLVALAGYWFVICRLHSVPFSLLRRRGELLFLSLRNGRRLLFVGIFLCHGLGQALFLEWIWPHIPDISLFIPSTLVTACIIALGATSFLAGVAAKRLNDQEKRGS